MAEVFIVDRVTTKPGCTQRFVDRYLADYVPGGRVRGMTLCDVLVSPPVTFDDRSNVVAITWSLPSPRAWWEMTWLGRPDPAVRRFWEGIGDLVVDRSRDVATGIDDINDDAPATTPGRAPAARPPTVGVTRLIDVAEADRDRVLTAVRMAAARSGADHSVVEPTATGSRNGGDILAHLRFASEDVWQESDFDTALTDSAIARVNGATYRGTPIRNGDDRTATVYRALLLRVPTDVPPETVTAFERDLATMPRYVSTIVSWQLSRVDSAVGATGWTHVFEQEFTDADGLMGPYLMHPIHWAVVDRWFDPECPEFIVRDRVCHSYCRLTSRVLS